MRSRRWACAILTAAFVEGAVLLACRDTTGVGDVPAIDSVDVQALSKSSVRISWQLIDHPDVIGYRIERRANFEGTFEALPTDVASQSPIGAPPFVFIDDGLDPETFYGYRVRALSRFGGMGKTSIVRSARTAPEPGLLVSIRSRLANSRSADADGYTVRATGPGGDVVNGKIEPDGTRRFNPLPEAEYTVWLTGLAPQCAVEGENERTAIVADSGINTIDSLSYDVQCRDPELGTIVVGVDVRGDSLAPSYKIDLTSEDALPDSVVSRTLGVQTAPGRYVQYSGTPFENLPPGAYSVRLSNTLAPQCDQLIDGEVVESAEGAQQVGVTALSLDTILFEVRCLKPFVDTSDRPVVMRNVFSEETAPSGTKITMTVMLDISKNPEQTASAVDWNTRYDPSILRVDSLKVNAFSGLNIQPNWNQPGVILFSSFSVLPLESGVHELADVFFTVVGQVGQSMRTSTTYTEFVSRDGAPQVPDSLLGAEEGLFEVGAPTGSNQPPTAVASANPTAVGVNENVAFTGDQSIDPDGTIVSYAWDFGDGETSMQANPTHQYADPGTYMATLTVTDDDDEADEDEVQITVAVSAPTAAIASVSPKIVGMTVTFDGSGSSGTSALTYDWNFAGVDLLDAGPTPNHIFKTLGQKTVTLTVTDGNSSTDDAQITVQVNGPSADAGDDRSVFKDSVVTYDGTASQGAGLMYAWDFAGAAGSGGMPTHTFTTTGAQAVMLTVTDSLGFEDQDALTVTVVDATKFQWTSMFGQVSGGRVPLVITYDMRSDPNAGLNGFVVDSVMWDPAVLTFDEIVYDCTCGGQNTSPSTGPGVVRSVRAIPFTADRIGLVEIATIWFDVVGGPGSSTEVTTEFDESMNRIFGEVSGVAEQFLPRTEIIDGAFTVPVPQVGTVQGQVTSNATMNGISGVEVTVTPAGGTALPPATADASGNYMVSDVPVSDGTGLIAVTLATLPADCQAVASNVGPFQYSGLTNGGTAVLNQEMDCPPPPVGGYEFSATWADPNPSVGSQAVLQSVIDMSTYDDPNNANDDGTLGTLDHRFTYNSAVLTVVNQGTPCVATDQFAGWSVIPNAGTAGLVIISMFTTSGNAANPKPLLSCAFNVVGTGTSSQEYTFTGVANGAAAVLDPSKIVVVLNQDLTAN